MSTFTVSSTAALLSTLKTAHAGDTILLAPGTYAAVNLYNYNPSGTITITSANALNPAVITSLNLTQSSNLSFTNLTLATSLANAASSTQATTPFVVNGSQNISFNHISAHGTMDGNAQNDVNGMRIEGSSNVTVINSEFQQFYNAITELNNVGVNISNNTIHDIRNDGIDNGGSSNVVVSGNSFTNFFPVGAVGTTGDHADAIQFWTSNTTTDVNNIAIINNTVVRGSGSFIQGIFMTDQVGVHFNNVTITGNDIFGGEANGITVSNGNQVNISNNTVEGYADELSSIRLQNNTGVAMNDNVSNFLNLLGTNAIVSQNNDQLIGSVRAVSSTHVSPITTVAEVSNLHAYATASGNAMTGDIGAGLYLADVGVRVGSQQPVAATGQTVLVGTYGTLSVAANGTYTYTETKDGLTVGQTYDDHFLLTVAGASGGAASSSLDFIVNPNGVGNNQVDSLVAGSGAQTLSGFGAGSTLWSGTGSDTFVFSNKSQSTPSLQTVIEHFKAGDVVDLSAIDPKFHIVSKFDGHADELVLSHIGTGNWEIYGDTTGSGTANLAIHILGVSPSYNLTGADFHL